jgi:hypothetical protein
VRNDETSFAAMIETLPLTAQHCSYDLQSSVKLEQILKKYADREWTRFIWLRIGTSGGLLLLSSFLWAPGS